MDNGWEYSILKEHLIIIYIWQLGQYSCASHAFLNFVSGLISQLLMLCTWLPWCNVFTFMLHLSLLYMSLHLSPQFKYLYDLSYKLFTCTAVHVAKYCQHRWVMICSVKQPVAITIVALYPWILAHITASMRSNLVCLYQRQFKVIP